MIRVFMDFVLPWDLLIAGQKTGTVITEDRIKALDELGFKKWQVCLFRLILYPVRIPREEDAYIFHVVIRLVLRFIVICLLLRFEVEEKAWDEIQEMKEGTCHLQWIEDSNVGCKGWIGCVICSSWELRSLLWAEFDYLKKGILFKHDRMHTV